MISSWSFSFSSTIHRPNHHSQLDRASNSIYLRAKQHQFRMHKKKPRSNKFILLRMNIIFMNETLIIYVRVGGRELERRRSMSIVDFNIDCDFSSFTRHSFSLNSSNRFVFLRHSCICSVSQNHFERD